MQQMVQKLQIMIHINHSSQLFQHYERQEKRDVSLQGMTPKLKELNEKSSGSQKDVCFPGQP